MQGFQIQKQVTPTLVEKDVAQVTSQMNLMGGEDHHVIIVMVAIVMVIVTLALIQHYYQMIVQNV